MNITGLENNYYLSFNDIWIVVNGLTSDANILQVTFTNQTTGKSIPALELSPSPDNDFTFNVCVPVRYLFPAVDHISVNSLQQFQIEFNIKFEDITIPDETTSLTKFFVRGGRDKYSTAEWYLSASEELIVGKWIDWRGIVLPGYPKKIQGSTITDFVPTSSFKAFITSNCNYKIIKFLNSIGGYQYFVFERFEIKRKTKGGKTIPKRTSRLRADNFRNSSVSNERTIELQTYTPFEIQEVFIDLVDSPEIFLYNPDGDDDNSKWERLQIENNDSIENNWTRKYENKVEFSFSGYTNKIL